MKQYILALVLAVVSASVAFAVNPIKEGNMISGHVIVKGTEENIPYATVLIIGSGQGTVSNEEGQFEFRKLPAGKYKLRVSAVGYKTQEKEVTVSKDFTAVIHFPMEEESFMTDEVVVSANRNEVSRKAAPVVVNVMSTANHLVEAERILQRMIEKNPVLQKLIDDLDLVLVGASPIGNDDEKPP